MGCLVFVEGVAGVAGLHCQARVAGVQCQAGVSVVHCKAGVVLLTHCSLHCFRGFEWRSEEGLGDTWLLHVMA